MTMTTTAFFFVLRPSALAGDWEVTVFAGLGAPGRDNGGVWDCPTLADAIAAVKKRATVHGWTVGGVRQQGQDWTV